MDSDTSPGQRLIIGGMFLRCMSTAMWVVTADFSFMFVLGQNVYGMCELDEPGVWLVSFASCTDRRTYGKCNLHRVDWVLRVDCIRRGGVVEVPFDR